jgi:hypothetical protein
MSLHDRAVEFKFINAAVDISIVLLTIHLF